MQPLREGKRTRFAEQTNASVVLYLMVPLHSAPTPLLVALPFLVTIAAGCLSSDTDPPPDRPKPVSNWTVEDARAFNEFSLYWLGGEYEGLPLTYFGRPTDGDDVHHATFWYGEPSYAGGASGSWNPPLEVDIQPYCGYSPEEVQSQPRYLDPEITDIQVRGVYAYLARYDGDWNYLTLWSGNSAIHMSAHNTEFDIEQAAEDLIPIAEDTGESLKPLPPPVSTEC